MPAVSLKYTDDRSYSVVSEKICSDCSCSCGKYAPDLPRRFLSENADPDSGRSDWSVGFNLNKFIGIFQGIIDDFYQKTGGCTTGISFGKLPIRSIFPVKGFKFFLKIT